MINSNRRIGTNTKKTSGNDTLPPHPNPDPEAWNLLSAKVSFKVGKWFMKQEDNKRLYLTLEGDNLPSIHETGGTTVPGSPRRFPNMPTSQTIPTTEALKTKTSKQLKFQPVSFKIVL